MESCTEFCDSLRSLQLQNGALPPRDELVGQLRFDDEPGGSAQHLGTWAELLARTGCPVCQLVVAATHDSTELPIDPNQPIEIQLSPPECSFRLLFPSPLGIRLAFIAENEEHAHSPDRARIVGPAGIQLSRILSWLDTCNEHHTKCRVHKQDKKPKSDSTLLSLAPNCFRLIDLELRAVKHVSFDVRYVALSYVWGHIPMFKLQRANLEFLSTEGSLDIVRKDLPKTVNDAIDFVRALGERYLWVDALCLVQDDSKDVHDGIQSMNLIYRRSYFTIVAGSGVDANGGLPGLAADSQRASQIIQEVRPGLKMAVQHSIDWHLKHSVYNTRGWTLQEIVLPQRTVIFINNQVYFRCREANWAEETWADKWNQWLDADDSNISRIPDYTDSRLSSLWAYQKLCEDYSNRKVRNDGDALRAVSGILRQLAGRMDTGLVEGIPAYSLDMFLLFISSNGDLRRRTEFASFSWAGWEGRFMWPRENYTWHDDDKHSWKMENIIKWLNKKCLVHWTFWEPCGDVHDICTRRRGDPDPLVEFMNEHVGLFPGKTLRCLCGHDVSGGSKTIYHFPQPKWKMDGSDFNDDSDHFQVRFRPTSKTAKALDLSSSEAGADPWGRIHYRNLTALTVANKSMSIRLSKYKADPIEGHRDNGKWGLGHYSFRRSEDIVKQGEQREPYSDVRGERRQKAQTRMVVSETSSATEQGTPTFPAFSVLRFHTVSLRLSIGTALDKKAPSEPATDKLKYQMPPTPFDRIPGCPLYGKNGHIVGSLHPDNISLLDESTVSEIELLVLSRCQTPTLASALLKRDAPPMAFMQTKPWDLLWCLAVVWMGGIAERRGVAQIKTSALEGALEPGPELKCVLLG